MNDPTKIVSLTVNTAGEMTLNEVDADEATLAYWQTIVEGYIEHIGAPAHRFGFFANEEAKFSDMGINGEVSQWCWDHHWIAEGGPYADYIAGPVVFVGGPDDNGDTTSLTMHEVWQIATELANLGAKPTNFDLVSLAHAPGV